MNFIVNEPVEEYAAAHTTPVAELFERLAAETREKSDSPQMMVGLLEGRFLEFLVRQTKARRILELGTFTGWSSIAMALGLVEGGRITTCDVNEETTAIARRYAEEAGVAERIEYRLGPGLETIASLDGPFDLIFIDADKENYVNYYEAVLPKLADDGLIVADNVLWSGRVGGSRERGRETRSDIRGVQRPRAGGRARRVRDAHVQGRDAADPSRIRPSGSAPPASPARRRRGRAPARPVGTPGWGWRPRAFPPRVRSVCRCGSPRSRRSAQPRHRDGARPRDRRPVPACRGRPPPTTP